MTKPGLVDRVVVAIGLAMSAVLLLPTSALARFFPSDGPQPFDLPTSFPLFLCMSAAILVSAVVVGRGLRVRAGGRRGLAALLATGLLLALTALYNFYWLLVWDRTYDGLWFFWLLPPFLGLLAGTFWLALVTRKEARGGVPLFLLVGSVALLAVFFLSQRTDIGGLTAARAERLRTAIEAYHAQTGAYPARLTMLSPRYLPALGEPMVIFGEDWCYDSDGRSYQFGYVSREHWSSPELYATRFGASETDGRLPELCAGEIAALEARDPVYYQMRP